ncbi:hypothetical protein [Kitasatospora sp. NPDC001683]
MNAERFEERLMHELKNHVQQRAESPHPDQSATARPRRGVRVRWVPVGLASGLAAAVAGVALTVLPSQPAAAYTLQNDGSDLVKLTIVNPAGKIDLGKLQKDLDRIGVHSRVLAGDPDCATPWGGPDPTASPSPSSSPSTSPNPQPPRGETPRSAPPGSAHPSPGDTSLPADGWDIGGEDGKTVLYIRPGKIPAGKLLMVGFPLAKADPSHAYGVITAGLLDGSGPDCLPAPPPGTVHFQ